MLRAVRESGGAALAVRDAEMVAGMSELGRSKASAPRPRAAPRSTRCACCSRDGRIKPHDTVVLFNTGGALKYLDVLA